MRGANDPFDAKETKQILNPKSERNKELTYHACGEGGWFSIVVDARGMCQSRWNLDLARYVRVIYMNQVKLSNIMPKKIMQIKGCHWAPQ